VREVERDLGSFLGEEGKEEDKGAKRVGHTPWKKGALKDTVGTVGTVIVADKGVVDREDRVDRGDREDRVSEREGS